MDKGQISMSSQNRIGIISTRLAGTDGVSLETEKWVNILTSLGYECFFFTGESGWPEDRTFLLPEAHFKHPEILKLNKDLFDDYRRFNSTSSKITELKKHIKAHLHEFIEQFNINLLITENALSIPMNVPLGLAITEVIVETNLPTIAHHHDFSWERKRFSISGAEDYLRAAFPPTVRQIHHVVLNSFARKELALRTGLSSTLIPNVMDFESIPPDKDEYCEDMRRELGIEEDEHILLQPTRIVPRKRIELSIEIARRLAENCVVLITHHSGDEGQDYEDYLREYADILGVKIIFGAERFDYMRGSTPAGKKIYALSDAYHRSDIVTYPSRIEGFGNAFLETVYYRRPIVMSIYEIFKADILPKGFDIIGFGDYIDDVCISKSREVLNNPRKASDLTERNFQIAKRYYSFEILKNSITFLLSECLGS